MHPLLAVALLSSAATAQELKFEHAELCGTPPLAQTETSVVRCLDQAAAVGLSAIAKLDDNNAVWTSDRKFFRAASSWSRMKSRGKIHRQTTVLQCAASTSQRLAEKFSDCTPLDGRFDLFLPAEQVASLRWKSPYRGLNLLRRGPTKLKKKVEKLVELELPCKRIQISRTQCFGTCPAYRMVFDVNGVVTLFPEKHVEPTVVSSATIGHKGFADLCLVVEEQSKSWTRQYSKRATDQSSVVLQVDWNSEREPLRVSDTGFVGPPSLSVFHSHLNMLIDRLEWKPVKRPPN